MTIYFHSVKKEFFTKTIFSGIRMKITIEKGEKFGVVAKNGEGKTTLLKIISGQEAPDVGCVKIEPKRSTLFYLSVDHINEFKGTSEEFLLSINKYLFALKNQIEIISSDLNSPDKLLEYSNITDRYIKAGGYTWEVKADSLLKKLHISTKFVQTLSGGEKSRLIFAAIQIIDADLVLLDEPTNHLDLNTLKDLEQYIGTDKKSYIIISHDQKFLDNSVTKIISITNHRLKIFQGNYSSYKSQVEQDQKQHEENYLANQREINRLTLLSKKIIERNQSGMTKVSTGNPNVHNKAFVNTQGVRLKVAPDRDKMSAHYFNQKLESKMRDSKIVKRKIERLTPIIKPKKDWGINADFSSSKDSPDIIIRTQNIHYSFTSTNENESIMKSLEFPDFALYKGDRVALIGTNGSGKSTLAKIIMGEILNYSGKVLMPNSLTIGYYSQTHELLKLDKNVLENFLNLEHIEDYGIPPVIDARNYLHKMLFTGDMVKQKVSELSQGEKSKLALAKIVYSDPNFLLLDEPTNHLDIDSKERLEDSLKEYKGAMLIVSHDRYFMESIGIERYIDLDD